MWDRSLASPIGLRVWRFCGQWCRSQMRIRPGIAVAVAVAGGYSSDSTPSLGTSMCHQCSSKKTKNKTKNKQTKKKTAQDCVCVQTKMFTEWGNMFWVSCTTTQTFFLWWLSQVTDGWSWYKSQVKQKYRGWGVRESESEKGAWREETSVWMCLTD